MAMMARFRWPVVLIALAGLHCAPAAPPVPPKGKGSTTPAEVTPQPVKDRIEAALAHVKSRDLTTTHGFWTIFHGILGMGPETTTLLNEETKERVNAIEHIAAGKPVRGLKFVPTSHGLDVVTAKDKGLVEVFVGQGHQDQFVAEMVQWGLPPSRKFVVEGKNYTFGDFLKHTKMRASLKDKQELSWAVMIIGEHFGTDHAWANERGEHIRMEDVLRYELDQDMDTAACGGTHRLFGLTWVLHRHKERGKKIEGVWHDVVATLEKHKNQARKERNSDGSFSTDYFKSHGTKGDASLKISTTGHILEWLAFYLPDDELKKGWVEDAASALATLILSMREEAVEGGALYHATHGLQIYHDRVYGDPKAKRVYPSP
jgi:hypothetical protein